MGENKGEMKGLHSIRYLLASFRRFFLVCDLFSYLFSNFDQGFNIMPGKLFILQYFFLFFFIYTNKKNLLIKKGAQELDHQWINSGEINSVPAILTKKMDCQSASF